MKFDADSKPRSKVGAIVLAAGEGSRMGGIPKALIELQGTRLIERQLIALRDAGVDAVIVVTGFYHSAIEPAIQSAAQPAVASFSVRIIRNLHPEEGQTSSVRLGLEALGALSAEFAAVIMVLCDQPLINTSDIQELLTAFNKRQTGDILLPMVGEQRGNPIVISGHAMQAILGAGKEMVCRNYMDLHPESVTVFETNNLHFIMDVDSLVDIKVFTEKTGQTLTIPDAILWKM